MRAYGNVATATAFIHGVALEELDTEVMDSEDDDFAVVICAIATK